MTRGLAPRGFEMEEIRAADWTHRGLPLDDREVEVLKRSTVPARISNGAELLREENSLPEEAATGALRLLPLECHCFPVPKVQTNIARVPGWWFLVHRPSLV